MLRILPWITDGAVTFLDNYLGDRTKAGADINVFEFGMGNSTLYFLTKGCSVTTVDHDMNWVKAVANTAQQFSMDTRLRAYCLPRPYIQAYKGGEYAIISIDGRDRVACLKHVLATGLAKDAILVLDNTERVRGGRYAEYEDLLTDFVLLHFEQPALPGIPPQFANLPDRAGQRVPHRWITTIAYPKAGKPFTTAGRHF
jgi:hypothetical protein